MATPPAANPKVPVPPDQVLLMLSLPPNNCHNHVCEGCAHKEGRGSLYYDKWQGETIFCFDTSQRSAE